MAARSFSERQTGGPEVANSHAPQARGLGYGATGPMVNRCAARTRVKAPLLLIQMDLFDAPMQGPSFAPAPQTQAKRGGGAGRSPA